MKDASTSKTAGLAGTAYLNPNSWARSSVSNSERADVRSSIVNGALSEVLTRFDARAKPIIASLERASGWIPSNKWGAVFEFSKDFDKGRSFK